MASRGVGKIFKGRRRLPITFIKKVNFWVKNKKKLKIVSILMGGGAYPEIFQGGFEFLCMDGKI